MTHIDLASPNDVLLRCSQCNYQTLASETRLGTLSISNKCPDCSHSPELHVVARKSWIPITPDVDRPRPLPCWIPIIRKLLQSSDDDLFLLWATLCYEESCKDDNRDARVFIYAKLGQMFDLLYAYVHRENDVYQKESRRKILSIIEEYDQSQEKTDGRESEDCKENESNEEHNQNETASSDSEPTIVE